MKRIIGIVLAMGMAGAVFAEAPKKSQVLKEGHYTAKLKPFVCSGCPAFVEKAMAEINGIDSVAVEGATVHFTVKKGAAVNLADLQKNLKTYADKMGMGADYSLSDIKPGKKAA